MPASTEYKSAPLETYRWATEMRQRHFREVIRANEEGRLLVVGNMNAPKDLIAGIGDFVYMGGEPWAVAMSREGQKDLATPALEAVEKQGYARDMCAFTRYFLGSLLLGKTPFGPFPRPAFVLSQNQCDSKGKWFQAVSEHLGLPHFCVEYGVSGGDGTLLLNETGIRYMVTQFSEFIDWLQRHTGRPYDDAKMIAAVSNMYRARCYWGEILQMQATSPAPLEYKLLLPYFLCLEYWPYKDEAVALLKALRDEVAYRVAQGITPLPGERFRILHDFQPPWYALYLFRYLRENGVAVLGGSNQFFFMACVQKPSLQFQTMAPVDWEGIPRTREECLRWRAIVSCHIEQRNADPRVKTMYAMDALRSCKCHGIIFFQDRGCEGTPLHMPEMRLAVRRAGIPTMVYEANRADFREWSWSHMADSVDAFLETLGVPRSEIQRPGDTE